MAMFFIYSLDISGTRLALLLTISCLSFFTDLLSHIVGFAFIKYRDQRSTILAVDNFNGAILLGTYLVRIKCVS